MPAARRELRPQPIDGRGGSCGPVSRSAIFAGKALGVSTFIFAIQLLTPLASASSRRFFHQNSL